MSRPSARVVRMPDTMRYRITWERTPPRDQAPEVAERARRATLGQARRLYGAGGIPVVLSSHGADGPCCGPGYAFWLPEGADRDGRLDHLTVHVHEMDGAALAALLAVDVAIHSRRESWRAQWHWIGRSNDGDAPGALLGTARVWTSLHPLRRAVVREAAVLASRHAPLPGDGGRRFREGRWVLTGDDGYEVELHDVQTEGRCASGATISGRKRLPSPQNCRQASMGFTDGVAILCDIRLPKSLQSALMG